MYEAHPSIDTPPDDAVIWRYIDLGRLLALLHTKSLHMCRIDLFKDPWEGSWPREMMQALAAEVPSFSETFQEFVLQVKQQHYVSCWHESPTESAALWDQYASNSGVAIRTSIGRLKEAIKDERRYFLGRVSYIDFESQSRLEINALIPPFLKRKSFEHEHEVRVLYWDVEPTGARPAQAEDGLGLVVDTNELIEKVYLSPSSAGWLHRPVAELCRSYGVEAEVRRSSLYDPFIY